MAAIQNIPNWVASNSKNLLLHNSGVCKCKIKVSAEPYSLRNLSGRVLPCFDLTSGVCGQSLAFFGL